LFAMLGGHWLVLQSVAWTRMLADFSRQDSLPAAISKTFDGGRLLETLPALQHDPNRPEDVLKIGYSGNFMANKAEAFS